MYQTQQLGENINAVNGITKALPYTKEEMKMQPTRSLKSAKLLHNLNSGRGKSRFNQTMYRIQCDPLSQKNFFSHSLIFVFMLFFLALWFYTLAPSMLMLVRLVLTITVIAFMGTVFAFATLSRLFFAGAMFPFS